MQNMTIRVDGMSCALCVKSIEGALQGLGASGTADLEQSTVTVQYDEKKPFH